MLSTLHQQQRHPNAAPVKSSQMSILFRSQEAVTAIWEVCKCTGLLLNNMIINRRIFHFQTG